MINLYNQNLIKNKQGDFKTYGVRLISNTFMTSNNIDSAVKGITAQGEIVVEGYYNDVQAELLVIGEEIVRIMKVTPDATLRETKFKVERGVFGSPVTNILRGDFAVSVIDVSMDTERVSFSQNNDNMTDNPFLVSFGQGYIALHHKPAHWSKISKIQKYNWEPYKTKIFVFEGNDDQCVLVWTGFLKKFMSSLSNTTIADRVQLSMVDRMGMFWEKDLKKIEIIKELPIDEALSKIFEMPVEKIYFKHTDKSLYPLVNLYIPNTKKYYKEVIESFSSNGIRFFFTPKGHLHIFSEIMDNTNLQPTKALDDVKNLVDIGLSTDNQLVYNYYDTTYNEQFPLYDLDHGVNYKYKVENVRGTILQKNSNGDYDVREVAVNDTSIPPKMVNISDPVLLLKDNATGLEFICKLLDVTANGVVLVPLALFTQRGLLEFGRGQWMESLGFLNERTFTLYYSQETLPICSYLTGSDNSALTTTESLNIPVSPIIVDNDGTTELFNLNKEYDLTFGSGRNLQDLTYTGDFVGIDAFKGTWVGGTDLLYCREYEQSLKGLDIFITTTRSSDRSKVSYLPYYTNHDNTGFNLTLTDVTDDKGLRARFKNTIKNTIKIDSIDKVSFTPAEIIGSIAVLPKMGLQPNDILFAYKLLPDHTAEEELQFKKYQAGGVEIRVSSMSNDGGTTIHLNNPVYPHIEYGIIRMEDLVYIQEFYIRANPIVKTSDRIVYENVQSVTLYDGRKSFSLSETIFDKEYTRKLLSFINSGYSGLTRDSTKYILPIQTESDIQLELYDLITILDDTATYLDDTILWLITGKQIKCEPNRVVSYTLLNVFSREIEYIEINFSDTQKYTPVTDGTYEWSGIEEEDTGIIETQNSFEFTDTRLGFLRGILIDPSMFKIKTGKGFPSPKIESFGSNYQAYLDELFLDAYKVKFVVKIGSEFIYCSGMRGTLSGETVYILQVIFRQLANSKRELTLENRTAIVYLIAEGSSVDYGLYTSSFYCGNGTNSGFLSFNPIEGLIVKAQKIEFTTGESVATQTFVNNKVTSASTTLKEDYDTRFTMTEDQIQFVAGKVTNIEGDLVVMNSQITQEFDNIKLEIDNIEIDTTGLVKKTEVISSINLNTEGVRIQGKNLQLTGATTVNGVVNIYGANGLTVFDNNSDALSNKKSLLQGGQLIFYERSP